MEKYSSENRKQRILELEKVTNDFKEYQKYQFDFFDLNSINLSLDIPIYRIYDLKRLIETIKQNELVLVKPRLWEDPFENFLLNSQGQLENGEIVDFGPIRESFYAQCWTLKEECDGMWRNYRDKKYVGIKVKTTVKKLMEAFYDFSNPFHLQSYFIGKVDYVSEENLINFFKDKINFLYFNDSIELARTLLVKREAFSYEEEVRLIFHQPKSQEIENKKIKNQWSKVDVFKIKIDSNYLFGEIVFNPWDKGAVYLLLKNAFKESGYNGKIRSSNLYDKPFFISKI